MGGAVEELSQGRVSFESIPPMPTSACAGSTTGSSRRLTLSRLCPVGLLDGHDLNVRLCMLKHLS